MFKPVNNQRGMAMVLELVLVVGVLAVVGYAGYQAYQNHHARTASNQPAAAQADTKPNGKVSNALNALDADANAEADSSAQEAANVEGADSSASDVTNVEGSYSANQF